jgi:hypothetical protein
MNLRGPHASAIDSAQFVCDPCPHFLGGASLRERSRFLPAEQGGVEVVVRESDIAAVVRRDVKPHALANGRFANGYPIGKYRHLGCERTSSDRRIEHFLITGEALIAASEANGSAGSRPLYGLPLSCPFHPRSEEAREDALVTAADRVLRKIIDHVERKDVVHDYVPDQTARNL